MKLKVVHLLRKLDTINRDLEELENLQSVIQEDRIYSGRLRNSLGEEKTRLKKLKSRILSQVIVSPPQESGDHSGSAAINGNGMTARENRGPSAHFQISTSRPEIVLPRQRGKAGGETEKSAPARKEGEKAKDRKTMSSSPDSGTVRQETSSGEKSDSREQVTSFQFRYKQNEGKSEQ